MTDLLVRHRITRAEWRRAVDARVFDGQHVMLRNGEVVEMSPIGPLHSASVGRATRAIYRQLDPDRWLVRVQDPIARADDDEPQPDIAIAVARYDDYASDHPGPADIGLVIEVADTSYRQDRDGSIPDYAEAGIREAWIVDVRQRRVEVFRDPDPEARVYRSITSFVDGDSIAVVGITVEVSDVLPPPSAPRAT